MSGSGLHIRPAAHGSVPPERMKALVMTAPWSFDDTQPAVDAAFRNKIPPKHKKDGVFYLDIGMEGLLVDSRGEWGRAIFSRDDEEFPVMVPMNRVRIGATWRSLPDMLREAESIDPNPNQRLPYTTHPVHNYINRLWESFRQQTQRFQSLALSDYKIRQLFGANFAKNVSLISEGFTPQVRQIMSDGTFTLTNIATLPQVTPQWPAPGSRVVYIILYLRQDGGVGVGLYVGQTVYNAWHRLSQHQDSVDDISPHYNVARKSIPEDRRMIPIIVWHPDQVVPTEVVDMAEQTLMALFDSYARWTRSNNYRDNDPVGYSQVAFIKEVSDSIRLTCHLPSYNITGTNTQSPIFAKTRLMPFDCYRSSTKATGQRGMTTFRQARHVPPPRADNRSAQIKIRWTTPDGTVRETVVTIPPEISRVNTDLYLVFEIMHDGLPHEVPYLGCPTVGPFENFSVASSLGIALEWYDESANGWKRSYLNSKAYRRDFQAGLRASDTMKSIASWRRCMDLIQLLEGINYTGPLNGFYQSLHFLSADVKELVVDHLNQKVSWRPRPRQNKPAPKLALFEDNAYLLKSLLRNTKTLTNLTNPPIADFFSPSAGDARGYISSPFNGCDFCRYMQTDTRFPCERDPRFTDCWVCRCCAVMHRPCTWTARSHALEYWGSGAPYLFSKSQHSLCPTGPHRLLSFHRTITGSTKTVNIDDPIEGFQGLNALSRVSVDLGDEQESDGDENVSRGGSEDEN